MLDMSNSTEDASESRSAFGALTDIIIGFAEAKNMKVLIILEGGYGKLVPLSIVHAGSSLLFSNGGWSDDARQEYIDVEKDQKAVVKKFCQTMRNSAKK